MSAPALSASELESYWENGYVVVRDLIPRADLERCREVARAERIWSCIRAMSGDMTMAVPSRTSAGSWLSDSRDLVPVVPASVTRGTRSRESDNQLPALVRNSSSMASVSLSTSRGDAHDTATDGSPAVICPSPGNPSPRMSAKYG